MVLAISCTPKNVKKTPKSGRLEAWSDLRHSSAQSQSKLSCSEEPMCLDPYRQSAMTWKTSVDTSVTSGRWVNKAGECAAALDDAFRCSLGAGSVSGVEAL